MEINRYTIHEELGKGGMAIVYKAYDTRLDRVVALKVIQLESFPSKHQTSLLERFKLEARVSANLSHPNIVKVLDYGEEDGAPFLVMEFLPGGTLKERLGMPLPWMDVARLLAPIARALEHAHRQAGTIIHRDVKPSNILFTAGGIPMLSDFGIAKILETEETFELTATGAGVGTPDYMAPEQSDKGFDHRVDVYALGTVFYEMVTGRKPFKADTPLNVLIKKKTEPLPLPTKFVRGLPPSVEQILEKALAKNPDDRYKSMGEFALILENLAKGIFPKTPTSFSVTQKFNAKMAKPKLWLGLVGGITLCAIGAIIVARSNNLPPPQTQPTEQATGELKTLTAEPILGVSPLLKLPIPIETKTSAKDDSVFVFVTEGEFIMGSNQGDPYFWGAEAPMHNIYLDAFWIQKTEVTNKMYHICVEEDTCPLPSKTSSRSHRDYYNNEIYQDYPVINVSYAAATAYCQWIGGRLPTEAEWEKAARGTDGRLFPWGNNEIQDNFANLCDMNCTNLNTPEFGLNDGYEEVAPVGSFPAGSSPYSALDMAGNVLEWASDWYAIDYYENSPYDNPTGPTSGNKHPVRGGSWSSLRDGMRPSARTSKNPNESSDLIGFRCVQNDPFTGGTNLTAEDISNDATSNASSPDEVEIIVIPAGEFLRGASSDDFAELASLCPNCSLKMLEDAQPQKTIYLDAFWIDKFEVTNAQFSRFVDETDYRTTAERTDDYSYVQDPGLRDFVYVGDANWQHPQGGNSDIFNQDEYAVTQISWQDANAYCEWVGKRLPTEAEWEKAARGDDGRLFPWGDRPPHRSDLNFDFSPGYIVSVGDYLNGASPYGVLDMSGNVWEWVADYYAEDYYGKAPSANPQGSSNGDGRVMRGGSWASEYDPYLPFITTFYRLWNYEYISSDVLGFRCASSQ